MCSDSGEGSQPDGAREDIVQRRDPVVGGVPDAELPARGHAEGGVPERVGQPGHMASGEHQLSQSQERNTRTQHHRARVC